MRVYVKNKISIGGSSVVKNDAGDAVYKVKGKLFSPTRKKKIFDMNGNCLFTVRNKWFNFFVHKAYIYSAEGERIATVKNPPFSRKLTVYGVDEEITVDGEFFSALSTVYRGGVPIGTITREFTIMLDAFCLEADPAELPFLTALVIAIDNIFDKRAK